MSDSLRYVECPRDAWQSLTRLIPVNSKRRHLTDLLAAGFKTLDSGSFVSPKAVPQMANTEEVLADIERRDDSDFLCIIANRRGLERALATPAVSSVGFPLSVNETFQRRNTGRDLAHAWNLVAELMTHKERLRLVIYLSMGFGNPYGEPWTPEDTARAVVRLLDMGQQDIVLADTSATADSGRLSQVLESLDEPETLGLHLHSRPDSWRPLFETALSAGVRWFEGALGGVGGCPFADDELVANVPTEQVIPWFDAQGYDLGIDLSALPVLADEARDFQQRYA